MLKKKYVFSKITTKQLQITNDLSMKQLQITKDLSATQEKTKKIPTKNKLKWQVCHLRKITHKVKTVYATVR